MYDRLKDSNSKYEDKSCPSRMGQRTFYKLKNVTRDTHIHTHTPHTHTVCLNGEEMYRYLINCVDIFAPRLSTMGRGNLSWCGEILEFNGLMLDLRKKIFVVGINRRRCENESWMERSGS